MPSYVKILGLVSKNKIPGYTFSDTLLSVYKIMKSNIFFRPEEAMLKTGESLSSTSKLVLFWNNNIVAY